MAAKYFCDSCGVELTENNSRLKIKSTCGDDLIFHFNNLCISCIKKAIPDDN